MAAIALLKCRWSAMALLLVALAGCAPQPNSASSSGDTSRNALDWAGTYVGTLPCADCPGIRTRIELRDDGTFTRNVNKIVSDARIENRRWDLVELEGRAVAPPGERERPFFELDGANARVAGNASCNRFSGTYELAAGERLRLGPDLIATRMACGDLEQEQRFFGVLTRVESYTHAGDALSLNGPDGAPLARFRASNE